MSALSDWIFQSNQTKVITRNTNDILSPWPTLCLTWRQRFGKMNDFAMHEILENYFFYKWAMWFYGDHAVYI